MSWGTQQQIYSGGGRRGRQQIGRKWHRNRGRKSGGRILHSQQRKECQKRTDESDTEMDTCKEGRGELGTSQSHSRHKKGHMTNIYLTDSDEEAIVEFLRPIRSCTTRPMNILRTKQGRSVSGRGLPTVATSLSRCSRPSLSRKGYITASSLNPSLDRPQKR